MRGERFYSVDSLSGVHVLVVDDRHEARDVLSAILRYCGALVTVVGSRPEALKVLTVVRCDVVIADVTAPAVEGSELIRTLRGMKPEAGGVGRAIALGGPDARARSEAASAGFDAYLAKPIEPWELCRVVAGLAAGDRDRR